MKIKVVFIWKLLLQEGFLHRGKGNSLSSEEASFIFVSIRAGEWGRSESESESAAGTQFFSFSCFFFFHFPIVFPPFPNGGASAEEGGQVNNATNFSLVTKQAAHE